MAAGQLSRWKKIMKAYWAAWWHPFMNQVSFYDLEEAYLRAMGKKPKSLFKSGLFPRFWPEEDALYNPVLS